MGVAIHLIRFSVLFTSICEILKSSYHVWDLTRLSEEFGAYYWQNELRMESHEDCGGNFYCSGAAILNSSVIVKFECKSISRNKGFDYISYNILVTSKHF